MAKIGIKNVQIFGIHLQFNFFLLRYVFGQNKLENIMQSARISLNFSNFFKSNLT